MKAIVRFNTPIAQILLEAGADISIKNNMTRNAMYLTRMFGTYDIFELLLRKMYREESGLI